MEVLPRWVFEVHYVIRARLGLVIVVVTDDEVLSLRAVNDEVEFLDPPFVLDSIPLFVFVDVEDTGVLGVPAVLGDPDEIRRRKLTRPVVDIDGQIEGEFDVPDRVLVVRVVLAFEDVPPSSVSRIFLGLRATS